MTPHEACRQRIIRRSLKIAEENRQIHRDINYWNGLHPEETPIDVEMCLVTAALADEVRKIAEADTGTIPDELMERFMAAASEGL